MTLINTNLVGLGIQVFATELAFYALGGYKDIKRISSSFFPLSSLFVVFKVIKLVDSIFIGILASGFITPLLLKREISLITLAPSILGGIIVSWIIAQVIGSITIILQKKAEEKKAEENSFFSRWIFFE